MRFLCLHGAGTNSKVFEAQTAALRHELYDDHTYDFVEGVVPCARHAAIEHAADADDQYFLYYEPSEESVRHAIRDLARYIDTEGPFDGIMAFSQGCSLTATFLLDQQRSFQSITRAPGQVGKLRCAIFFCGRVPDLEVRDKQSEALDQIRLPTVHIWGANDTFEPGQGLALSQICDGQNRSVFVHDGGHEVPGARDKDALTESVHVINRMLRRI